MRRHEIESIKAQKAAVRKAIEEYCQCVVALEGAYASNSDEVKTQVKAKAPFSPLCL